MPDDVWYGQLCGQVEVGAQGVSLRRQRRHREDQRRGCKEKRSVAQVASTSIFASSLRVLRAFRELLGPRTHVPLVGRLKPGLQTAQITSSHRCILHRPGPDVGTTHDHALRPTSTLCYEIAIVDIRERAATLTRTLRARGRAQRSAAPRTHTLPSSASAAAAMRRANPHAQIENAARVRRCIRALDFV